MGFLDEHDILWKVKIVDIQQERSMHTALDIQNQAGC